jgi:hypothetical protein
MSDWVDVTLDVLASDPAEINNIAAALQERSDDREKAIVVFRQTKRLGSVHNSVNKARRFEEGFRPTFLRDVWSRIYFVSEHFPKAIFLVGYCNSPECGGKVVIRGGKEVRHSYFNDYVNDDGQLPKWAMPNIFASYEVEYYEGFEFGSLWDEWARDMRVAAAGLAEVQHEPDPDANAPRQSGGAESWLE